MACQNSKCFPFCVCMWLNVKIWFFCFPKWPPTAASSLLSRWECSFWNQFWLLKPSWFFSHCPTSRKERELLSLSYFSFLPKASVVHVQWSFPLSYVQGQILKFFRCTVKRTAHKASYPYDIVHLQVFWRFLAQENNMGCITGFIFWMWAVWNHRIWAFQHQQPIRKWLGLTEM